MVRPVDSLGLGLGPANPHALLTALSARDDFSDLTIGGALLLGLFDVVARPGVHYRCGFYGPVEPAAREGGKGADIQLVPAGFRQFAPVLSAPRAPRVMAVQATPPDVDGALQPVAALRRDPRRSRRGGRGSRAGAPSVELDECLPRTRSALRGATDNTTRSALHSSPLIESATSLLVALPEAEATEADEEAEIAEAHTLRYVPDGSTLQTVGAIPPPWPGSPSAPAATTARTRDAHQRADGVCTGRARSRTREGALRRDDGDDVRPRLPRAVPMAGRERRRRLRPGRRCERPLGDPPEPQLRLDQRRDPVFRPLRPGGGRPVDGP